MSKLFPYWGSSLFRRRSADHPQLFDPRLLYFGNCFHDRAVTYILIRPHEIELADRFFAQHGAATVFIGRLLPVVRTFISFPAGVARMRLSTFIIYSTAGAFIWSCLLIYAGVLLGDNWEEIRHMLQPFDLAIAVGVVMAVLLFIWWRLGMPGWRRTKPAA